MLHLDTGNTAFTLLCASLVMLMTPGLAFFYGGLVGRKNVLAIMMQSFVSMGWTTVIWFAFGYSLCFSGGAGGVIGAAALAVCLSTASVARAESVKFEAHVPLENITLINPALIAIFQGVVLREGDDFFGRTVIVALPAATASTTGTSGTIPTAATAGGRRTWRSSVPSATAS